MKSKVLILLVSMSLFSVTSFAGFKLGDVVKKPKSGSDSQGAGLVNIKQEVTPNEKRRQELIDLVASAPEQTVPGLEEFFTKKFGVRGFKEVSSDRMAWLVRINQIKTFNNCLLVKVTKGSGNTPSFLDMADAQCDHSGLGKVPVVWEYMK